MAGTAERPWTPDETAGLVAAVTETAAPIAALVAAPTRCRDAVCDAFADSKDEKVLVELAAIGVASLRDVSRERLRIGTLADAGVRTVADVVRAGPAGLDRLPGIGPQTATHCLAAAEQIARAVRESLRFRIDFTPLDPTATCLVQALYALDAVERVTRDHGEAARAFLAGCEATAAPLRSLTDRLRRLVAGPGRRRQAREAATTLAALLDEARASGLAEEARRVAGLTEAPVPPHVAWEDFRRRSAAYYALLDRVVATGRDLAATEGHLPAELLRRVADQTLTESSLRVSLRGYQAFGARYALAQGRVVLGDEMGLGKTVQAIAVIGHLVDAGATHALVVCPASVLATWVREVGTHSVLAVHAVHGPGRSAALAAWRAGGGVAVTTFATLRSDGTEMFGAPALLVVDEAHYVKNPLAKRSLAVADLASRIDRVLFLTGTAMENRVEEFRTLVGYLRPDLAGRIDPADGAAGAEVFRRAVAPVYLRRNQEDVLAELPELVQVDDWLRLGCVDGAAYRGAVADGSFMAMRRAAYAVEHGEDSVKLRRLVELVGEATGNGRKVVVFSYFRDVVRLVADALGDLAVGPLTGSVPVPTRQAIIDDFTSSPVARALVSQIDVGGVGLNLQAASVVVLCEPQTKPTTEEQAIARVHRMGQVDTVQVHRLLGVETVDEHLTRILQTKARLFDAYARRSALADEVAAAVDVSEAQLARTIVAAEQARLVVDPRVLTVEDAPVDDVPAEVVTDLTG